MKFGEMKDRLAIWRERLQTPASLLWDSMNSFRLVGRGLLLPEQGKRIFSRIADFGAQVCGGGIVVPSESSITSAIPVERDAAVTGKRIGSDLRLISSVIQLDGDIVLRLHPEYRQATAEHRKAALDHHFEDVLRALSPMQELRSLIFTIAATFRTAVAVFWGYFEIVPLWENAGSWGNLWDAFRYHIPIWTHLASAAALVFAIAAPGLLRLIIYRVTQNKLQQQTQHDWIANKGDFAEQSTER